MPSLAVASIDEIYGEIENREAHLLITHEDRLRDIRHALLQKRPNEALALLDQLIEWIKL